MKHMLTARDVFATVTAGILMNGVATGAGAQATSTGMDAAYIAKVSTAAPDAIVKGATIIAMDGTSMRTVQKGTNDFTCMVGGDGAPMCADRNAMEWVHALQTHVAPPDKIGFVYMLAGDQGASNTDPFATAATANNHWVKTGPHVMILGAAAKSLGYARTPDIEPAKPSVMWAGTPYEHVMIPVK